MSRSLVLSVLLAAWASVAAQQPQTSTDTGAVVGKVIDGSTNQPLSGATVSIFVGGKGQSILSDDQGRFAFNDLPADARSLQAHILGYVGGLYGQTTAAGGGETFEFTTGLKLTGVTLRLWKGGVITGRVLDGHGDPLVGVAVQALRRRVSGGHAQTGTKSGDAATDDQGQYRITGLVPGMYTLVLPSGSTNVSVRMSLNQSSSRPATPTGFPAVFFPGVFDAETARFLPVEAATEVSAGDLRLPKVPMFIVSGRLTGLDVVSTSAKIHLLSMGASGRPSVMDVWTTSPRSDGSFSFSRVAPGQYLIRALVSPKPTGAQQMGSGGFMVPNTGPLPQPTDDPSYWADTTVTVDAKNIDDLVLPFLLGAPIAGRVVFDGATAAPVAEVLGRMPVVVQSADGRPLDSFQLATVKPDNTFKTVSLPAGAYGVALMPIIGVPVLPLSWSLQSMTVGGREVSGASFTLGAGGVNDLVITMTDRPAELSGLVTAGEKPKPHASVYVFPSDRRMWTDYADGFGAGRLIAVVASDAGTYKFGALLPGEYLVAASLGPVPDDWKLADALEALAKAAVIVKIDKNEKKTLNLTAR